MLMHEGPVLDIEVRVGRVLLTSSGGIPETNPDFPEQMERILGMLVNLNGRVGVFWSQVFWEFLKL